MRVPGALALEGQRGAQHEVLAVARADGLETHRQPAARVITSYSIHYTKLYDIVREIGPGVRGLAPGDPVVCTIIPSCGRCFYCVRGEDPLCA